MCAPCPREVVTAYSFTQVQALSYFSWVTWIRPNDPGAAFLCHCNHELTDAMDDDETAVAGAGEIVDGVYFDSWEREDLMID